MFSSSMTATRATAVKAVVVTVTLVFIGILGWYLGKPGYTQSRLVLFVVLGGSAVAGALGVVFQRALVTAGAAGSLVLLGFWQAVLWMYILPVVLVLVVAALVTTDAPHADTPATE